MLRPLNTAEEAVLSQTLARLKTRELKSCSLGEQVLLSRLLLANPRDSTSVHWYCHSATDLTREAATYCQVWLVANDSSTDTIVNWTRVHRKILDSCVDCVKGMEDALLASQFTCVSHMDTSTMALIDFPDIYLSIGRTNWISIFRNMQNGTLLDSSNTLNDSPTGKKWINCAQHSPTISFITQGY